jgi:CheY-like chemotaxis protein
METQTILVVEDFVAVQQFLRETLESRGYKTLGAINGDNAYEILANYTQRVNLVVTDYHMPGSSGFDLIKKIKENPALKNIPVIFLTTEANPEIIKKVKQVGFTSWIKKPYRPEVLLNEIETAIAGFHS